MTKLADTTVCVVGIWHLGIINTVGFASQGYRVIGLEFDSEKAKLLQNGTPPIYEPGLDELQNKYLKNGQLSFFDNPKLVSQAEFVVIAYDSPVNDKDEVDISPIVESAKKIAPHLNVDTPLIITSQLPLGSSQEIEKLIQKINPKWLSGVVYTPENLRLGNAIECFLKPDMLVLGANNTQVLKKAQELYQPFDSSKIIMNLKSAEMVKHALNGFLATSIAFGNEIANISERLGADGVAVANALKLDKRIGKAPILPGLGFSGGTLARDITQLKKFADKYKYSAKLIQSIVDINENSFDQIVAKLTDLLGNLNGKTIGILGLTYKPGTSTMRRSPSIKIIQKLVKLKAKCLGYDPMADEKEFTKYKKLVIRIKNPVELATKSDALVLITQWDEFASLDFNKLADKMRKPIFIDTKNFIDPKLLTEAGFIWQGFGRKG